MRPAGLSGLLALMALLAVLSGCRSPMVTDAGLRDVVTIGSMQVTTDDASLPPRVAELPSQHLRSPRSFLRFTARARFEIAEVGAHPLWSIYIAAFSHGGEIRINGVQVGEVRTSTADTTVWYTRPYLFTLPVNVLRSGTNELEIRWGGRESLTLLSRIFIGPHDVLLQPYQQRLFWQNQMAEVALVHSLVIASILLGIYSLRRHQQHYLTLGLGAIGFSIIVLTYMLPPMPAWAYPLWRALHIGGIALFTCGAWLFLIQQARPESRWYPRFCIAWALLGPVVYLIHFALTGVTFFKRFETTWGILSGLIGLYPVGLLAWSLVQGWRWRSFIFVVATSLAIVMGVADIVLQGTARSVFGNVGYSLQTVSPLWFTALTMVLVLDFASSLVKEAEQRRDMAAQLELQRRELTTLYDASRERERQHAVLAERQRIMQDIHDGLGSQLISSLALSEAGALDARQTSMLLRECIDDLRLAIDALPSEEHGFWSALGNLRFRMTPRLKAAGIALRWQRADLANPLQASPVEPTPEQSLMILRILQEALTNTLKHAGATEVMVSVQAVDGVLEVIVDDNGVGFDAEQVRHGKGLSGIATRARRLGATLEVRSRTGANRQGTRILLRMPLVPALPGPVASADPSPPGST